MKEGVSSNLNYNLAYCFFLPAMFYHSVLSTQDLPTCLLLILTLVSFAAVVPLHKHKALHTVIALIATGDLLLKVLMVEGVIKQPSQTYFNLQIVRNILSVGHQPIDYRSLLYLTMIGLSWSIVWTFNLRTKSRVETLEQFKFLEFLSQTLQYVTPILLYILCFTKLTNNSSFRQWLETLSPEISQIELGHFDMYEQVAWGVATALYLTSSKQNTNLRRFLTVITVIMIVRDHFEESSVESVVLYELKWKIVAVVKVCLLLFFRIHNKAIIYADLVEIVEVSENQGSSVGSRMSSHMRYVYRKKISEMRSINHFIVLLVLLIAIITVSLTNGLGNSLTILGIACNFPVFDEVRFRRMLAIGTIVSLLLQPQQFIYFMFLYIIRIFKTEDHVFSLKNWWLVVELVRVTVLLAKVSLLTFLIGVSQNKWLVVLTLLFRNICSYYKEIIVFMGTDDNYAYFIQDIVPKSIVIDLILWGYLLILKIYSTSKSIKFASTDITNIFEEYPVVRYCERGLKVLKFFHWIAYAAISMIILNSTPSLFTLLRIIPLVAVFTLGILQSHKSQWSYCLWSWNFYTALIIAFVKYFYLLSQYSNLSPWLVSLLEPLIEHHKFIGLSPPDNTSLLVVFGPDFFLIVVNAVVLFVIKVELSELSFYAVRARIYEQQRLQQKLVKPEEAQQQQKNIHYLYNMYIKPIDLKFKTDSLLRLIFTDNILELCFLCFLCVYYLLARHQSKFNYICHFALFLYGFLKQQGKHHASYLFHWFVAICSLDLLLIYIRYFFSLIAGVELDYDLYTVISKYLLLIVAVFYQQIYFALQKYYTQQQHPHMQHAFLLFRWLTPQINNETYRKEVIILYLQGFKIVSIALFITLLLSGSKELQYIHIITLAAVALAFLFMGEDRRSLIKSYWMHFFMVAVFLDLWLGYLTSILCFLSLRVYYMVVEEFDLHIYQIRYERSNKTDYEQSRQKIQEQEDKLEEKYNFPRKARLEVIEEANQKREASGDSRSQQFQWQHKNIYLTVVWLLPFGCVLVIQFGSLFYSSGASGFIIFFLNALSMLYILKNLFSCTIESKVIKMIAITSSAVIITSLIYEIIMEHPQYGLLGYYQFGLFFILTGTFGYFELLWDNNDLSVNLNLSHSYYLNFCQKRSLEAIEYWNMKCEMVSELGSQIHNEKKLTSLRSFFIHRENLAAKVEQLEQELKFKASHRKTHFQRLERVESEEEQQMFKKGQFDVYSNMLTFMSLQDLHFCYLNLNQYYRERGISKVNTDLAQNIRNVREWVLNNFQRSIAFTLNKYEEVTSVQLSREGEPTIKIMPVIEQQKIEEDQGLNSKQNNGTELVQLGYAEKQTSLEEEYQKIEKGQDNIDEQKEEEEEDIKPNEDQEYYPEVRKERQFSKLLEICSEAHVSAPVKHQLRESYGRRVDQRLNELSWVFRKLVQNIETIGLIITAGWNFQGGVYTIPTNIAIFSWALVLQTKTTVVFWFFLMLYCLLIIGCKLLLDYLPKHLFINFLFYYHPNDYFYEFLIVMISAVEIIFLKMGGTSQIAYSQRENIFDAFYRTLLNQAARGRQTQKEQQFLTVYKHMRHANKHSFFHRVFSKGRLKPGKDFYPMLAIVQVVILFYIFFFYDMMEFQSKNNRKSLGQILIVSQFSKNMILALFFQVVIMIADRFIVALNWIDLLNQRLENFFFSFAFKYASKYTSLSVEELQMLGTFDYLLIIKYVFHVVLLVAINFFVYFYIPSGGFQKSLIPECELSVCGKSYNYLSIFLLLYLIYFVISGLQIKHGFNRNKCRNTLMERYHWIDYYIYLFFTGIPFLWEFKKISDWTTTATSLPLFHWMKFQDINARMYRSKCEAEILRAKQLGKGSWYKPLLGPLGFLFVLAIIFSPLLMYSSFNPFAVKDSIMSASSRLQLVLNDKIHYDFFKTSHIQIHDGSQEQHKHNLLGLFDKADLYKLESSSYPDQDFPLSEPALDQLAQQLNTNGSDGNRRVFQFRLIIDISEKIGGDNSIEWGSKTLDDEEVAALYSTITQRQEVLQIQNFYSPLPGTLSNQSIVIINRNQTQYFEVYTTAINPSQEIMDEALSGIYVFYKSSVKYKVAIGLLTFYLTYVVLINSLFRFYLTGSTETIIFEGPQLQKILFLCEAVRSARILQNFYQEQYLYFSLMDLMRHPRMIKDIADDFSNMRKPFHKKTD